MSKDCISLVKIIAALGLVCLAAGVLFIYFYTNAQTESMLYYAIGIVLGTAISAARIVLLERTLNKSVDMAPVDAQNYTRLHYSFRMIGIVAAAFIAVKVKQIDIIGFVIGLLLVPPAVYLHKGISKD